MFVSTIELKEFLKSVIAGYRTPGDEFFTQTNENLLPEFKKLGVITVEEDLDASDDDSATTINCNVPGCFLNFKDVHAYQSHYNSVHRFICCSCKRTLPTPHLLDLHISENHDAFFLARVDRGEPMYKCYLEECKELMPTPATRKQHCIKVHKFPANFRFDQISVKKKQQKNKSNKMELDAPECSNLAQNVKAFTFGHGKERSFNKQCKKHPLEDLSDLKMALD